MMSNEWRFVFCFCFSIVLLNIGTTLVLADRVSVRIGQTEYIGADKVVLDQTVHTFTGIPYAKPPVNDLRFKRPVPVKTSGVFEATNWPKACPQIDKQVPQSEDCLKLNIWTKDVSASKPVMVWFHGGGFVYGAGHNGEVLATVGDVVVVTLNYRLGALGFLFGDREDAPGNMGLWDQVLALEWVNDNIRYFGGDVSRITVFGWSAGSRSISMHLLSGQSRQLFRNAIMMSGSQLSRLSNTDKHYSQRLRLKLAKHVDCNPTDSTIFTDEIMKCMRTVPADRLVSGQHSGDVLESQFAFFPNVIFGDQFMTDSVTDCMAKKDVKKKINLLLGTTEDEGSWILNNIYDQKPPTVWTKVDAIREMSKIFSDLPVEPRIDGQTIAKFYLSGIPADVNPSVWTKTLGVALGDFFIGCPALKYADLLYRLDAKHNKIYGYYWSYKSDTLCDEWAGACHGSDIEPAMGLPYILDGSTDLQKQLSTKFMKTIAYFAKHDHPLEQEGVQWPHYYDIDGNTIAPYYEFSGQTNNLTNNFGVGLKHIECQQIFDKYYN